MLRLADPRVLHERALGDLLGGLPQALPHVPRRWLALQDRKWLGRGLAEGRDGGAADAGWALYERIVLR